MRVGRRSVRRAPATQPAPRVGERRRDVGRLARAGRRLEQLAVEPIHEQRRRAIVHGPQADDHVAGAGAEQRLVQPLVAFRSRDGAHDAAAGGQGHEARVEVPRRLDVVDRDAAGSWRGIG